MRSNFEYMIDHPNIGAQELRRLLLSGLIRYAGNRKLKIYGSLHCKSGERMKKGNRVFFNDENEALEKGYRPCGKCLRKKFLEWKKSGFLDKVLRHY